MGRLQAEIQLGRLRIPVLRGKAGGRLQLRGAARRDGDPLDLRVVVGAAFKSGRTLMRAATLTPSETGSRPVLMAISPVDGTFSSTVIACPGRTLCRSR